MCGADHHPSSLHRFLAPLLPLLTCTELPLSPSSAIIGLLHHERRSWRDRFIRFATQSCSASSPPRTHSTHGSPRFSDRIASSTVWSCTMDGRCWFAGIALRLPARPTRLPPRAQPSKNRQSVVNPIPSSVPAAFGALVMCHHGHGSTPNPAPRSPLLAQPPSFRSRRIFH